MFDIFLGGPMVAGNLTCLKQRMLEFMNGYRAAPTQKPTTQLHLRSFEIFSEKATSEKVPPSKGCLLPP